MERVAEQLLARPATVDDWMVEWVSGAAMDLYRLRWVLDDIALSVRDFRAPHEQNEDTALMWDATTEHIGGIG